MVPNLCQVAMVPLQDPPWLQDYKVFMEELTINFGPYDAVLQLHNNSELRTPVLLIGQTLRLVPESPISTTLYHSIFNPQILPLLLDMVSLLYFLFKHCFTLPYLLFPALPSVMPICSDLLISEFPKFPSVPVRLYGIWVYLLTVILYLSIDWRLKRIKKCLSIKK